MSYQLVDAADIEAGPGPHPAASAYDKRLSQTLGLRAFEVYQVELPAGAETVRHNHNHDGVEDLYAIIAGHGWLLVDEEEIPIRPGQFIAVTIDAQRHVRAGEAGLTLIAVCSAP